MTHGDDGAESEVSFVIGGVGFGLKPGGFIELRIVRLLQIEYRQKFPKWHGVRPLRSELPVKATVTCQLEVHSGCP